jgi:hypothetical protein
VLLGPGAAGDKVGAEVAPLMFLELAEVAEPMVGFFISAEGSMFAGSRVADCIVVYQ